MRLWKNAAIVVTALGVLAALLVLLARWGGIRLDGFGVFYSATAQDLVGISTLFLFGAILYLLDQVNDLRTTAHPSRGRDLEEGMVEDRGEHEFTEDTGSVIAPTAAVQTDTTASALVRVTSLSKVYELGPVKVHALRDANLDVSPGSLTVILGPSGSGKTTLLNLLGGIDRATSGKIVFHGTDVARLDDAELIEYRRERVGFVFQFFNLIPSLTARENVALAAELVPDAADVEKVLRIVGLGDRMDHFPAELSGGEQQRVAIARALVKNPPLLLCDEPTGELDYATGVKILEILKGVAHGDGRAVIVVTHNATIAEMADQVVRLRGGRIDQVTRNEVPVPPAMLRW